MIQVLWSFYNRNFLRLQRDREIPQTLTMKTHE